MRTIEELRQQVAFERWANRAQVTSIETVPEPGDDLLRIAWHLLAAAEHWLARIDGGVTAVSLDWLTPGRDELPALLDTVDAHYARFVEEIDDARLVETFAYVNSAGQQFESLVGDALQHLMLHSAEHRGQIALEVGRLGGEPVETEYAWYLREGRYQP